MHVELKEKKKDNNKNNWFMFVMLVRPSDDIIESKIVISSNKADGAIENN